ncbi:MAG TPA: response regulator [Dongiaceae bacterium]|jgi:CheY-like chemotaxis protein|nr:response regulator [Dongiaceae bacterium]
MYLRPSARGRPRIIVMDRDAPTLSRLCDLLRSRGYVAVGVETAPAACRMVHRQRVDLVLTTIALPEPDRRAWASALSHLDVAVPVIAMCEASSAHALNLFDTANEFGATAVLRRPFTASTLLQMLADLLPAAMRRAAAEPLPARADWPGLVSGSSAIH